MLNIRPYQSDIRELEGKFVNGTLFQQVLDRWKSVLSTRYIYLLFFASVIICALVGPFGIFDQETILDRLTMSLVLNLICWIPGILISVPVRLILNRRGMSLYPSIVFATLTANLFIAPFFVWGLEHWTGQQFGSTRILEQIVAISLVVLLFATLIIRILPHRNAPAQNQLAVQTEIAVLDSGECTARCPLLQQMSVDKCGTIWALIAQDHYVKVVTDRGSELLLMRLGDAIDYCKTRPGYQCHRSAWISFAGMSDIRRDNRRLYVRLPNGDELPVSRSREKLIRSYFEANRNL